MANKMKKSNYDFENIYIFVAVTILFVGVFIGSVWLAGQSVLKWFETLGSLATAGTFLFMLYQHKQIKERQDTQESKQEEMWAEQKEMLSFQKFQIHKSMFFSLLEELEEKLNVVFENKSKLYRSLFPKNNINNFDSKTQKIKGELGLPNIIYLYNAVVSDIKKTSQMDINEISRHFDRAFYLIDALYVKINVHHQLGSVFYNVNGGKYYLFNVFNPEEAILIYREVIERISDFCDEYTELKLVDTSGYYEEGIMDYCFSPWRNNSVNGKVIIELRGHEFPLGNLYSVYKHIKNLRPNYSYVGYKFFKNLTPNENISYKAVLSNFRDVLNADACNNDRSDYLKKMFEIENWCMKNKHVS